MEGIHVIVSIVERGRGTAIQKLYKKHAVFLHTQCPGRGTATSEIMDILGLGSSEKDVVLSYAESGTARRLLALLDNELRGAAGTAGIVFTLSLSGMNNLAAAAIDYYAQQNKKGNGGEPPMENQSKNSLILVTCVRGSADQIMVTAREQGARGGTVIKARWSGMEELERGYDLELTAERDIVAIVVPNDKRKDIMEAVNAAHGLRTPEQAMICSAVPWAMTRPPWLPAPGPISTI